MGEHDPNVVAEVTNDSVVRVRFDVPNAKNAITVDGDRVVIDLADQPSYQDYQDDYKTTIENFAAMVGSEEESPGTLESDWSRVYEKAAKRGKIVLKAISDNGEETDDGLKADYDAIEKALENEGYKIKGKTMPGIFRGINTQIRDYLTGVDDTSEARDVLKQTHDDNGNRYRLVVKERDGRRYAEAFKRAMEGKEL